MDNGITYSKKSYEISHCDSIYIHRHINISKDVMITPLAVEDRIIKNVAVEVEGIVGLEVSGNQC